MPMHRYFSVQNELEIIVISVRDFTGNLVVSIYGPCINSSHGQIA